MQTGSVDVIMAHLHNLHSTQTSERREVVYRLSSYLVTSEQSFHYRSALLIGNYSKLQQILRIKLLQKFLTTLFLRDILTRSSISQHISVTSSLSVYEKDPTLTKPSKKHNLQLVTVD